MKIAMQRPGALGDILMSTHTVQALKKRHPQAVIDYYCAASLIPVMEPLIHEIGVDRVLQSPFWDVRDQYDLAVNFWGYPDRIDGVLPRMQQHVIAAFAKEAGVDPSECAIDLPLPPKPPMVGPSPYVTLQTTTGWSRYKNWSIDRWDDVCDWLHEQGYEVYQIGGGADGLLRDAHHHLLGDFQACLHAQAHAVLHLGLDSVWNHTTDIRWDGRKTRAVILWGSSQHDATGYSHNTNLSLGLGCQPCFREDPTISAYPGGVCTNPPGQAHNRPRHACMLGISVQQVIDAARAVLGPKPQGEKDLSRVTVTSDTPPRTIT